MDFALQPPEVNSGLMYTGPGAGPMLAAAAGWDAVATQLELAASGCTAQVAELTGRWLGPSSLTMAGAAAHQVGWLHATAAQAAKTAAQAYAAAAAYEAAYAMTVPPPVVAANRAQLMVLVATNFLGQNTPAIAATEAQYMEMWVQDATAMYAYAADSEAASALQPFDQPQQTARPDGQLDQTRAVAQAAGNTTSARTQSLVQLSSSTTTQQLNSSGVPNQLASSAAAYADPAIGPGSYTVTTPLGEGSVAIIGAQADSTVTVTLQSGNGVILLGDGFTMPLVQGVPTAVQPNAPVMLSAGSSAVVDVGSGTANISGSDGFVITSLTPAATPLAPGTAPAAPTAAVASGSPGLAGTSGIQPQLNASALLGETVCTPARADLLGQADAGVPMPLQAPALEPV
ncbi:MAG: PPE family protein [Actinomycetota bacterium]|uniref:PPE family protein n=1 Tax=Mycobacterium lentiflavum TaxID=141349 RepID=UPI0023EF2550|nr:PPE family protein [Mycobacterium lentiflavum]MEE3063724.1 PPE family protein [Actinomycetota bacterium]